MDYAVIFARWRPYVTDVVYCSLGSLELAPQMASWSVHPFLQGTWSWPMHRPNCISTCIGIASIYALHAVILQCGLTIMIMITRRHSESAYIRQVIGWGREMADVLWEGHTLLKTGLSAHRQTDTHSHKSENSISASFTPFTFRYNNADSVLSGCQLSEIIQILSKPFMYLTV